MHIYLDYRGSTSVESAGLGGLAHLVNFEGTDTLAALVAAEEYYGECMAGYSLPATEHSTMTTWGRDNEVGAVRQVFFISSEIFHRRGVWGWGCILFTRHFEDTFETVNRYLLPTC